MKTPVNDRQGNVIGYYQRQGDNIAIFNAMGDRFWSLHETIEHARNAIFSYNNQNF